MTNYSKTLCLLTTSILLVSCSSKFNSREEAFNAQRKFLGEGKEVVVVDVPTDDEVEEQNYWEKSLLVGTCKTVKEHLRTGEDPTGKPIAFAYLQQKRAFVEEKCSNPELTPIQTKETLTKRTKEKNRLCNEEQETSQFVCKEWKVSGDEIMKDKWRDLEPTYSYFRY